VRKAGRISKSTKASKRKALFVPMFIGGAWRGGTTVLHALVCTSPRSNDYVGECSHLMYLIEAYISANRYFDIHGRFYFRDRNGMQAVFAKMINDELLRIWSYLGKPKILSLKSPALTRHFALMSQMIPEAKFVVVVRDACDVVASRLRVLRKQRVSGSTVSLVRAECQDYVGQYEALRRGSFGDRLCVIEYERLVVGDVSALAKFGLKDIDIGRLWRSKITNIKKMKRTPFTTSLYGHKLSRSSIGKSRKLLSPRIRAEIRRICGPTEGAIRAMGQTAGAGRRSKDRSIR
jgi:hypothetical protein